MKIKIAELPRIDKYNKKKQPKRIKINIDQIPNELKKENVWCCWIWEYKGKKWTKPPCDINGNIKSHLSMDFSFEQVIEAYNNNKNIAGIGFSLRSDSDFCGIDIDNCIDKNGIIDNEALEIITKTKSYCEISPSGTGVRVFGFGKPATLGATKNNKVEIYNQGRYLTVTGLECSKFGLTNNKYNLKNIEKEANKIRKWIVEDDYYTNTDIELIKGKKKKKKEGKKNDDFVYKNEDGNLIKDKIARSVWNTIMNFDCESYETWLRVGMAIKTEFEDSKNYYNDIRPLNDRLEKGLLVWCKWSQISKLKYDEKTCSEKWRSFNKKDGFRITLYSLRRELSKDKLFTKTKAFEEIGDVSISLSKLIKMKANETEFVIKPIIPKETCNMIHARRGLGKTNFALSLAIAIATGGKFLHYQAPYPQRVLYLDGELPENENIAYMQRAVELNKNNCNIEKYSKNLKLISSYSFEDKVFPQFVYEGMEYINGFVNAFAPEVVIIDSLATVMQWSDSRMDAWQAIQSWLIGLRNKNICVILIHHDNKAGTGQRGFSNKEDILNTVIHLKPCPGYSPVLGACFKVEYSKSRGLHGEDAKEFIARICKDETAFIKDLHKNDKSAKGCYKWAKYEESEFIELIVADYFKQGLSTVQVQERLNNYAFDGKKIDVATYRDITVDKGLLKPEEIRVSKKSVPMVWQNTVDGFAKANPRRKKEQLEAVKENGEVRVYNSKQKTRKLIEEKRDKIKAKKDKSYYSGKPERLFKKFKEFGDLGIEEIINYLKAGVDFETVAKAFSWLKNGIEKLDSFGKSISEKLFLFYQFRYDPKIKTLIKSTNFKDEQKEKIENFIDENLTIEKELAKYKADQKKKAKVY